MKRNEKADLERRVAELERRVKELESQPREYHYHAPVYQPLIPTVPYVPPHIWPSPAWIGDPLSPRYQITCGGPALNSAMGNYGA